MRLLLDIELTRGSFELKIKQNIDSTLTGIFGPSGSGKTTLLEAICGLLKPDRGKISFNGQTFFSSEDSIYISPQKRKVGMVFQDIRIFPHLNVKDNLKYGYNLLTSKEQNIKFDEVVELLELENFLQRNPGCLSGGEKQRVVIGRSLLCSPDLLLLDEPFSAIDKGMRQTIMPYLSKIEKQIKLPMMIVSHHLPDLQQLTEKILHIENGQNGKYTKVQ